MTTMMMTKRKRPSGTTWLRGSLIVGSVAATLIGGEVIARQEQLRNVLSATGVGEVAPVIPLTSSPEGQPWLLPREPIPTPFVSTALEKLPAPSLAAATGAPRPDPTDIATQAAGQIELPPLPTVATANRSAFQAGAVASLPSIELQPMPSINIPPPQPAASSRSSR